MEPVRFATIGTSWITERFLRAVASCPGARLTAVYSRDLARARAFGEPLGATFFYSSLDELAASDEVDAVYIASPNLLHGPQALQMIEADKAVLVEKPLASTLAETRQVLEAARARGVACMEAMRLAHDPGYATVRELLPQLGPLRRSTMRYDQYSSRYDLLKAGEHTNIFDPALATGALMDLGVYPLHATVSLFGAPLDLRSLGITVDVTGQDDLIDIAGSALLAYDGMVAEASWGKCVEEALGCAISGEEGTLRWEKVGQPRNLVLTPRGGAPRVVEVPNADLDPDLNLVYELEDFLGAMAGTYDTAKANHDSLVVAGIMEAIRMAEGVVFPTDEAALEG